ncbi:MAG: long-chain fatty acid--CoA ligase [Thermocrispum agreste]|uniref:Acyl-CoA synthetase n=2 Tax=Thermocrispum agreste TaxID=37925 RepID=A0ABD6FCB7_9PSEU
MTTTGEIALTHQSGKKVRTLPEAFQETARLRPSAVALRTPGNKVAITWREYADRVRKLAAGFAALGVGHGDTVGVLLTNRPEFHLVDTAALHLGAAPFSIYITSSPEQISYLFSNADNKVVVTEQKFLKTIQATQSDVEHVVVVDGEAGEGTLTLDDVMARGSDDFDFEATWRAVRPSDLATVIYTSGTTGPPKGVEITHANLMAEADAIVKLTATTADDRITSYLPHAHIADRMTAHYANLLMGVQVTTVDDPRAIAAALPDTRPTVWLGVPRVWQKLKAGVEAKLAAEESPIKKKLAGWAVDVGIRAAKLRLNGESVPLPLRIQAQLADRLVLGKIRHALGFDQLRHGISGAAAIPIDTLYFFWGLGIPVYEVWGMSENCGGATSNVAGANRVGTVGRPMHGIEVKLAEDGELLLRGAVVMRGYRKQPDKTAEAIDADGWLHTGDIGTIDEDGYVRIVDRKKELIINEAGKNMSPTNIENAMKAASPLIGQVVAIGDNRPYITALVVLDPEAVQAKKDDFGLAELTPSAAAENPKVRDAVTADIREGNKRLSRVEQIKRFVILPQFWEPGGDEITPTMKLKRKPIAEKYAADIEALYSTPAGPAVIDLG